MKNPKMPTLYVTHKGHKGHKGMSSGAPWRSCTLQRPTFMGAPQRGFLDPQVLLEAFWEKPQKVAFHKYPKSIFTIHDNIFQRSFELKIFMWA